MNLLGGVGTVAAKENQLVSVVSDQARSKYSNTLIMFKLKAKVTSYWEMYALNRNRSLTCEVNN